MAQTRKLLPTETTLLAEHVLRLSPEDRRLRFGGMFLHDEAVLRYVNAIDWTQSWLVGFFAEGALRAVVQLSVLRPDQPSMLPWPNRGAAEFAVSVENQWRRRGVATRLLSQAVVVARNRHLRNLYMLCLPENEPIRRLARKLGIRLVFNGGEISGHVELPGPDQLTVFAEFATEAAAAIDRWAELLVPSPGPSLSEPGGVGPNVSLR